MNTGSIFHAGALTNSDRYKWTIWKLWDQPPRPQREPAAEPGTALALPPLCLAVATKDRVALQPSRECLELRSVRNHPKHSNDATQDQNIQSVTQPLFLQRNPRNRRNDAISLDGYFLLQVLI